MLDDLNDNAIIFIHNLACIFLKHFKVRGHEEGDTDGPCIRFIHATIEERGPQELCVLTGVDIGEILDALGWGSENPLPPLFPKFAKRLDA